ncbi:helix-turn-helix domain-containing protein [Variovorax sp. dw_954]|nr:helix-turn-helix domain-containing protein [Variovorax sp. dw_954]
MAARANVRVLSFPEFDQFAESLQGFQGQYFITKRQVQEWKLQIIDLDGVSIMTGQEGAARIFNGVGKDHCFHVYFVLDGQGDVKTDGRALGTSDVAWTVPQQAFHTFSQGPIRWLNVSIRADLLQAWVNIHEDEFPRALLTQSIVKRACAATAELERIVGSLSSTSANPRESALRLAARQSVLDATMRALVPLGNHDASPDRAVNRRRIVDRALQKLEASVGDAIDTAQLCNASGTSERTLRNAFQAHFGVGPHNYVMLHRLHAIRERIRRAQPCDSVTSLCSRFGIWDYGRFARAYRMQFGTLPSQDLYGDSRWPRSAIRHGDVQ